MLSKFPNFCLLASKLMTFWSGTETLCFHTTNGNFVCCNCATQYCALRNAALCRKSELDRAFLYNPFYLNDSTPCHKKQLGRTENPSEVKQGYVSISIRVT